MNPRKPSINRLVKAFNRGAENFATELRFSAEVSKEKATKDFSALSSSVVEILKNNPKIEQRTTLGNTMRSICDHVLSASIMPPLSEDERLVYTEKRGAYIQLVETAGLAALNPGPTDTRALVTNQKKSY